MPNNEKQYLKVENQTISAELAVNINTASVAEMEKLPQIGEQTAQEIVNYREKYGKFRKPEHLLLVRGISDQKFRRLKSLIKVE